jgi:hypothetical protein
VFLAKVCDESARLLCCASLQAKWRSSKKLRHRHSKGSGLVGRSRYETVDNERSVTPGTGDHEGISSRRPGMLEREVAHTRAVAKSYACRQINNVLARFSVRYHRVQRATRRNPARQADAERRANIGVVALGGSCTAKSDDPKRLVSEYCAVLCFS